MKINKFDIPRLVRLLQAHPGDGEEVPRELGGLVIPILDVSSFFGDAPVSKPFLGGVLSLIPVPQPPINVDPAPIIVPTGIRWFFRGWTGTLLTGAVAGNRQVGLQIINSAGIIQAMYMDNVSPFQPPSRSDQYFFHQPGGQNTFVPTVNFHSIPCAYGDTVQLKSGWQVGTKTQGIQAGDSWQPNIFLVVEEFADSTQPGVFPGSS